MKKSLVTIVTLLLVLINLVLTALLTFTIMPQTKKANELITKVADAIDLDLTSGEAVATSGSTSLEDMEVYTLADSVNVNLKKGEDGDDHIASLSKVSLTINTKSENHDTYNKDTMSDFDGIITDAITKIVSQYTKDDLQANSALIQEEIKDELAGSFGGDLVTAVKWSIIIQ